MAVDPYAMCPCGSGKKLKFCCTDLVGEIEKIHRMIEGEQPRAALRHVEQTLATHPGRASLLDLKATLEMSLGDLDAARQTVKEFVAKNRDSATAHACEAILLAEDDKPREAVDSLQRALAIVEREMPLRVFEALGAVGGALLEAGHILGAQAHLWLHAALAPKDDTRSREVLAALNHYSGLPLILRDQLRFRPWPEGVPWKAEAEKATRLADNGKWREAVDVLDQLGHKYGADPALLFNRALLGGWLADDRALVAGLHAYAQLDVPLDDAVEAEAIAQMLDADLKEKRLDSTIQMIAIRDLDELVAKFSSDKRVQSFEVDPQTFADRDQPRPRNTFVLLDRPMPATGVGITRDSVPRLAGILAIYGRQTDRPELLEMSVDKGPAFDSSIAAVKEIAGDTLGDLLEEKIIGSVSPTDQAINWRWHPPKDTPPETRRQLIEEERRAAIVDRWPKLPQPALLGKTALEAASDPELRIPLLANLLILEQGGNSTGDIDSIAELRRNLNLPQPDAIVPESYSISGLPLVRIPRLKIESVEDDDLVILYRRSIMIGAHGATLRLAREAVARPSLADRIPPADAYQRMIAAERDPDKALVLINAAREQSKAIGQSTATWDLAELELHITTGNVHEAKDLLDQIQREHGNDPQVAAALYQLLYETGVISEEQMGRPHSHTHGPAPVAAAASAPEPAAGQIWTPAAIGQPAASRPCGRHPSRSDFSLTNPRLTGYSLSNAIVTRRDNDDVRFMSHALALATRGQGSVEPNPMVGCAIVRGGEIVGEGWHEYFGGPHAEANALAMAGERAAGATVYVSLEPCCHQGKMPPCTQALIGAGVARVVVAVVDPFPQVSGRGIAALEAAGIECEVGVNGADAAWLLAPYRKLISTGRPWVIAKWAMTLDGKLATHTGDSQWISSETSRAVVHQLRGRVDAVVVGSRTACVDNPLLTARPANLADVKRIATRVVVDSAALISLESRLVQTAPDVPVLLAAGVDAPPDACNRLASAGVDVFRCPGSTHAERIASLLDEMGGRRMTNVLVEGGSQLLGTMFDMRAVDEVHVFIAPKLAGGTAAPGPVGGAGIERMSAALKLADITIEELDGDVYVHGRIGK